LVLKLSKGRFRAFMGQYERDMKRQWICFFPRWPFFS
jgi:hypothetical protein